MYQSYYSTVFAFQVKKKIKKAAWRGTFPDSLKI